ncbi:hypothetical protein AAMO2058_000712800 [Amorphochlora amoebiformis]
MHKVRSDDVRSLKEVKSNGSCATSYVSDSKNLVTPSSRSTGAINLKPKHDLSPAKLGMQSPHPLRIRRSLLLFPSAQHVNVTAPDEKKVISKSSSRLSRALSLVAMRGLKSGFLFNDENSAPKPHFSNPQSSPGAMPRSTVVEKHEKESKEAGEYLKEYYIYIIYLICISFFVTKTFQPILLQWNRINGKYPFPVTSSIWVSRIILTLFFGVWIVCDGDLPTKHEWRKSVPFVAVALCTIANVLSIYLTVAFLGAGTYAVLKNLNLAFTAVLIYFWLRRADALENGELNMGYFFVLLGVTASTLEGIVLQLVTKDYTNMTFQKQSFFYHFYSFLLSTVLMLSYDYEVVFDTGPFTGWNYRVVVYLLCIVPLVSMKHAVAGLVSAIMVKIIVAGTTVSTFVFAIIIFGKTPDLIQWLSAMVICVALVCYQLERKRLQQDAMFKLDFLHGRINPNPGGKSNPGDNTQGIVIQCSRCKSNVAKLPVDERRMQFINIRSQSIHDLNSKHDIEVAEKHSLNMAEISEDVAMTKQKERL